MRMYILRAGPHKHGECQRWEEILDVHEVSFSFENGGHADIFAPDDETLRVTMSGHHVGAACRVAGQLFWGCRQIEKTEVEY